MTTVGDLVFDHSTGTVFLPFSHGNEPDGWSDDWLYKGSIATNNIIPKVEYTE